ncbi:unnamed protein product [Ambrosiozyma monospora]|uniref:Unnamed protein product n=1 Tax=Ambrosiozyma monospora TaxID=43982 RepID=A0ACB5T0E6_AMBMO|nr:unnamed protein product [Ambrosiozyma monospora]
MSMMFFDVMKYIDSIMFPEYLSQLSVNFIKIIIEKFEKICSACDKIDNSLVKQIQEKWKHYQDGDLAYFNQGFSIEQSIDSKALEGIAEIPTVNPYTVGIISDDEMESDKEDGDLEKDRNEIPALMNSQAVGSFDMNLTPVTSNQQQEQQLSYPSQFQNNTQQEQNHSTNTSEPGFNHWKQMNFLISQQQATPDQFFNNSNQLYNDSNTNMNNEKSNSITSEPTPTIANTFMEQGSYSFSDTNTHLQHPHDELQRSRSTGNTPTQASILPTNSMAPMTAASLSGIPVNSSTSTSPPPNLTQQQLRFQQQNDNMMNYASPSTIFNYQGIPTPGATNGNGNGLGMGLGDLGFPTTPSLSQLFK